jgi:putative oxidoreductase
VQGGGEVNTSPGGGLTVLPGAGLALRWALRLGLGGIFAWAGAIKLQDPAAFATDIANYQLVAALAPVAAATLPMIELVLGLSLVFAPQGWRRAAALATAGLMAVFTAAIGQAVARGIRIECGCFGGAGSPVTWWTVARDLALLAAAVALLFFEGDPSAGSGSTDLRPAAIASNSQAPRRWPST